MRSRRSTRRCRRRWPGSGGNSRNGSPTPASGTRPSGFWRTGNTRFACIHSKTCGQRIRDRSRLLAGAVPRVAVPRVVMPRVAMPEIGRSFRLADLAFPLRHQDLSDQNPHRGEGESERGMDGFDVDHDRACTGKLETGRSARFLGPKRVVGAGPMWSLWAARTSRHRAPILAQVCVSASCGQ